MVTKIVAGLGAVIVAMAVVLWLLNSKLISANSEIGSLEQSISEFQKHEKQIQSINADQRQNILALEQALKTANEAYSKKYKEAVSQLEQAELERDELRKQQQSQNIELELLLQQDCEAWASLPVCGAIGDRLRNARAGHSIRN